MENNQEFKAGKNEISLVGVVKEQKLEKGKNDSGENVITGNLIIKTGENSEITLNCYTKELTSKGTVKKAYTTLEGFIDGDNPTMANCSEEKTATKVKVFGNGDFTPNFNENIYKPEGSNDVKTSLRMNLGFGNIVIDNTLKEEDFKAEFDVEIYVNNIREEEVPDDSEENPRVLIDGYLPTYNGAAIPLTIVAPNEETEDGELISEIVQGMLEVGDTFNAWGEINYQKIVETITKGGNGKNSFGKAKVEEKVSYVNELILTGGDVSDPDEAEDDDSIIIFTEEQIKLAIAERNKKIEEEKNKESSGTNKKKSGISGKKSGEKRNRSRF